jgi:hypothetical protein
VSDRFHAKNLPDPASVEYVYELAGPLQEVADPAGTYGFAHDNMGAAVTRKSEELSLERRSG